MGKKYFTSLFFTGIVLIILLAGCAENYSRVNADEYIYNSNFEDSDLPPVTFRSPPELVVFPNTYVYVVPDASVDIFFYNGFWWRPWNGRWYRSYHYGSGWQHYRNVPSFYRNIPRGWRNDYRSNRWGGSRWNHQRIPHQNVQRNWRDWEKSRYWERKHNWGLQERRPRTRSQQPDWNQNKRMENHDRRRDQDNRRERFNRERNQNNRIERSNPEWNHNRRMERPDRERSQNNRPSREIRQQENRREPTEVKKRRPKRQEEAESTGQDRRQENIQPQERTPIEEQFEKIYNSK